MKKTVTVKLPDGSKVTKEYDFGENLGAAVAALGEEVVFSLFVTGAATQLRNAMRSFAHGDTVPDSDQILEHFASWIPSKAGTKEARDPFLAAVVALRAMSSEERAEKVKQLKEMLATE